MPKVLIARTLPGTQGRRDLMAKPLYYERVFLLTGADLPPFSIWHPVCPRGYQALGDVCHQSLDEPSVDIIRAV